MRKVKVLVFGITEIIGGTESYLLNLLKHFPLDKYEFDFMCITRKKVCLEGEFNELFNDNRNHFYYPPNMKKNLYLSHRWLKKFYDTHIYDIIYMNVTSAARIIYCNYAIKKYGTKLITHNHCGNSINWYAGINNSLFKRYTTKISDVKLACSDKAFKWGFLCDIYEGYIIQNGIDISRFFYNEKFRKDSEDAIVIGHIGRFSAEKNHDYFIKLAKKLDDKYCFLFAGEGPLKNEFINKIKYQHIEDKFRILPFTIETEKLYSAMDIFCMPSLYEGLPIVSVEAQASGLSCVFSENVSKQADICGNNYFCSLEKIEDWVLTLKTIPRHRNKNVTTLIRTGYDIQSTAKRIQEIFESVLKNDENK